MERSPWIALAIASSLAWGCASEPPDRAAQRTPDETAEQQGGRHFVVRPLDSAQPAGADPWPAESGPAEAAPVGEEPLPSEQPLGTTPIAPESSLTPVPSPVEEAFNPLREEPVHESFEAAPLAGNPLRAFRSAARSAIPPASAIPIEEPTAALSAGEKPQDAASAPAAAAPEHAASTEPPPAAAPVRMAPMSLLDEPAAKSPPAGAFDVVQVFYGTDRAAIEPAVGSLPEQVSRLLPTAICVLITLALGLVAMAKGRPAVWLLVGCGVLMSLGLGYQAASGTLGAVRRSGHVGPRYTSNRSPSGAVQLGLCEVTIPKSHAVGQLEAPSILRLEIHPDADKHVILAKTERLADEPFYEQLRARVAASPRKELFVFVHGFNVTFEDAARRTAQIQHDLNFAGAPVFFSWPAHDQFVLTYAADANNVTWSVAHLKKFLLDVTRHSQAQSINLIAHSMGNRALTAALKELQLELRDESRLFNQVILAAPDIDADEFRQSIAPGLLRTAKRVTLYASSRDEALAASQLVHRGPRAGDAGRGLVVIEGIDTIDVTAIDSSPWGHSYYGSSDPVLRDLGLLLSGAVPPSQRVWLSPADFNGLPYWVFQPASTTTARAAGDAAR